MPGAYDDLAKVAFRITGEEGESDVETLWATPLGNDLYRLKNSPWFAYGVSFLDVVRARPDDAGGFPVFEAVVEKSGNRTLRLLLDPPAEDGNESARLLDKLVEMGASCEGANRRFMALNIEAHEDLARICRFLTDRALEWEHADPTYEELYSGR